MCDQGSTSVQICQLRSLKSVHCLLFLPAIENNHKNKRKFFSITHINNIKLKLNLIFLSITKKRSSDATIAKYDLITTLLTALFYPAVLSAARKRFQKTVWGGKSFSVLCCNCNSSHATNILCPVNLVIINNFISCIS